MENFRQAYHSLGSRLNKVIFGVGATKEYLAKIKGREGEERLINDCIHNMTVIEEGALQLEQELAVLKKLTYRLMDPDRDFQKIRGEIEAANRDIYLLVVDDDEGLCDIIRRSYAHKGFQVETASTKEAALAALERKVPDIVLLDLYLNGGQEGVDILKVVKGKSEGVRVIVVTYEDQEEKLREVKALGPDEVLTKPIRGAQLEAKINGLIKSLKG